MPVLIVYGVPTDHDVKSFQERLQVFTIVMKKAVANIKELGLSEDQISVFFPKDHQFQDEEKEEIIIFVDGLTKKPERTPKIRRKLAVDLVEATNRMFPNANLIECFVKPFNPENGFCHWW
jgi:hypothetical protein